MCGIADGKSPVVEALTRGDCPDQTGQPRDLRIRQQEILCQLGDRLAAVAHL